MAAKKNKSVTANSSSPPKAKRCQFTLPPDDVGLIDKLRKRYQDLTLPESETYVEVAKSEVVRAGLQALNEMSDKKLQKAIASIEKLPEGRPKQQ